MSLNDNTSKINALLAKINALPDSSGETADPVLQAKSVTPAKSAQTVSPDSGYDGLSQVTVGAIPSQYIVPSGTLNITASGDYDVTAYAKASVDIDSGSGGLPTGITALAGGSYTPAEDVTTYEFTHNLGVTPNFFLLHATGLDDYTEMDGYVVRNIATFYPYTTTSTRQWAGYMSATSHDYEMLGGYISESNVSDYVTETLVKDGGDELPLKAGVTYRWIAGVMDGI